LSQTTAIPQPVAPLAVLRPLCVDLDGTLVKSDTLVDSLLALMRTHPALVFRLPDRLLTGKAAFKAFVAESVSLDVVHLPYNRALLHFLNQEHARGRGIFLSTGADTRLALRVAEHLGIFTDVLASDGATNLTGSNKLDALRNRLDNAAFDYVGNDAPDLPLLAHSSEAMVANPSLRLRMKLKARGIHPVQTFEDRKPLTQSFLTALRVHQWAKNLLIFVPLLCSHALTQAKLLAALAAFFCFSFTAASAYIVNDLVDIDADRRHPRKLQRPFAAGDLPAIAGVIMAAIFLVVGLTGAAMLPGRFFAWELVYLATTLAYSLYLKRFALVDVLVLSGLYILRLLAGGSVTLTPISHWLAGFSMFLFLSLAIVKRFAELKNLSAANDLPWNDLPRNGRGYLVTDLDQLRSFGTASAYAAVVVFAIYITGPEVVQLYHKPRLLWLSVPLITLWLNRVWLLASRGRLDEDPVAFALTDRMSQLIGIAVVIVMLLAI
jgi:4-hydroxybenzoate polyprenyltransferase/phosphoserine phosphatase